MIGRRQGRAAETRTRAGIGQVVKIDDGILRKGRSGQQDGGTEHRKDSSMSHIHFSR